MVVGSAEKNLIHVRGSYSTAIPTTKKPRGLKRLFQLANNVWTLFNADKSSSIATTRLKSTRPVY